MDDVVNVACSEETLVVSSSTPDTLLCSPIQQSSVSVSSIAVHMNTELANAG